MSGKLSEAELLDIRNRRAALEGNRAKLHGADVWCRAVDPLLGHISALQSERDELLRACEAALKEVEQQHLPVLYPEPLCELCRCIETLKSAIARAQGEKGTEPCS